MPFWDATGWDKDDEHRILLPEFADRKFFAQDGSDYRADVYTTPDFFCAEFDAAPPHHPEQHAIDQTLRKPHESQRPSSA